MGWHDLVLLVFKCCSCLNAGGTAHDNIGKWIRVQRCHPSALVNSRIRGRVLNKHDKANHLPPPPFFLVSAAELHQLEA